MRSPNLKTLRPGWLLRGAASSLLLLGLAACRNPGMPVYPEGYREFAYVANSAGNTVSVLDLVYLRQDRTLSVGADPVALAVNPRLDEVYVVNAQEGQGAGSISVVDTQKNQVVATVPVHRSPSAIAIDPEGLRAYVTNAGSNTVSVLDLRARRAISSAPAGEHPGALALSPDGRSLVVTSVGDGSIHIFSVGRSEHNAAASARLGEGLQPAALTARATFTGCPGATSPVILPDSSKFFVACAAGHQVLAVGLAAAHGLGAARQDSVTSSDHVLTLLDVGQQPAHLTLKPDGGEIFVSNLASNSVSEIATSTDEVGSTFGIGNGPTHGIVSGDNGALWVSASAADSISLYSIDEGKFLSSVRSGSGPGALAFSADEHLLLVADARSGDVAVIRTASKLGPALLTILPAGGSPSAIVVKAMQRKP